jgi:hypothetical protein
VEHQRTGDAVTIVEIVLTAVVYLLVMVCGYVLGWAHGYDAGRKSGRAAMGLRTKLHTRERNHE